MALCLLIKKIENVFISADPNGEQLGLIFSRPRRDLWGVISFRVEPRFRALEKTGLFFGL